MRATAGAPRRGHSRARVAGTHRNDRAPPRWPDGNDDLVLRADLHVLDDHALHAQRPRPYPCLAHVASRSFRFQPSRSRNLGAARRALCYRGLTDPREQQERQKCPIDVQ